MKKTDKHANEENGKERKGKIRKPSWNAKTETLQLLVAPNLRLNNGYFKLCSVTM
jgi:hypothetical protein